MVWNHPDEFSTVGVFSGSLGGGAKTIMMKTMMIDFTGSCIN
jgi:hypothetical protein